MTDVKGFRAGAAARVCEVHCGFLHGVRIRVADLDCHKTPRAVQSWGKKVYA